MAAISTIAAISLAVTAVSTVQQIQQQSKANRASRRAQQEQEKAQSSQRASEESRRRQEQAEQGRRERIQRAQVLQGAYNTGTSGSSGEFGAIGGLQTALSSNLGILQGSAMHADDISTFSQNAANQSARAQRATNSAALWGQIGGASSSIFSQAGGFSNLPGGGGTRDTGNLTGQSLTNSTSIFRRDL